MYGNNQQISQRKATGAIAASVIVSEDIANDGCAIQATANYGRVLGLSPVYSTATGAMIPITTAGVGQLTLGGTVAAGDYLKSDANGAGVVIATGGTAPQHVVGVAVRSGVSGDVIPVQVNPELMTAGQDYLS